MTLLELLVVMAIVGVLTAIFVQTYLGNRNAARNATSVVTTSLSRIRSQSMSNIQARRVKIVNNQFVVQSALSCSETDETKWTAAEGIPVDQTAQPVTFTTSTPLLVCYTPRGLATADGSKALVVNDGKHNYIIQISLGGGVISNVAPNSVP